MLFVPLPFPKAPSYIQSLTGSQEIAFTAVIHLIPCIHHRCHLAPLFIFHAIPPGPGGNIVSEFVRLDGCLSVKGKKNLLLLKTGKKGGSE